MRSREEVVGRSLNRSLGPHIVVGVILLVVFSAFDVTVQSHSNATPLAGVVATPNKIGPSLQGSSISQTRTTNPPDSHSRSGLGAMQDGDASTSEESPTMGDPWIGSESAPTGSVGLTGEGPQVAQAALSLQQGAGPASGNPMTCDSANGVVQCSSPQKNTLHPLGSPAPSWTKLTPSTAPPIRSDFTMTYDSLDGYVVLFGGYDGSAMVDTWKFVGGQWTLLSPSTPPPARYGACMTYDTLDNYVVLFGGYNTFAGGYLGDTWKFTGGQWSQLSPSTPPGPRVFSSMAYDDFDKYVVLFGGYDGTNDLGETWKFTGGQWTHLTPLKSPSGRDSASMANDTGDKYVVLFGGQNTSGSLQDTWEFLTGQWVSLSPSTPPSIRHAAGMANDTGLGFIVLFGGANPGYLGDTWKYMGGKWSQLSPATSPPARAHHSMAYDYADKYLVLFGGDVTGTGNSNDTWWFGLPPPSVSTPIPSPATVDVGQKVTFTTTASGGTGSYTTYTWTQSSLSLGCTIANSASISCTPTAAGTTYTVSVYVTDSSGATSPSATSANFVATADPTVSVSPLGPLTYDQGQPAATLQATIAYSGPNTASVQWFRSTVPSCNAGSTNTGNSGTAFTPPTATAGTTYYCAVVSDSGVAGYTNASNAVQVIVSSALVVPAPTVNHNPADVGQAITFTAAPTGGSGGYSYSWSGLPMGCTSSNNKTITCQPSSTSGSPFSVKVTVTDSNSNTVTSSPLSFTVDPPLVAGSISANHNPADVGQTVVFSSTAATGGSLSYTYSWTGLPVGTGCASANSLTITCTPSSTTGSPFSITISVTDTNGNTVSSSAFSFTVDPVLAVGTVSANHNPADVGQTVVFSSTAATGGSLSYTYSWTGLPTGAGCASANSLTITCTPSTTAGSPFSVKVSVTDSNSNTNTSSALSFTVDPALVPGTVSVTRNPADVGQTVVFSSTAATGGSLSYTYSWIGLPTGTGCTSANSLTITCTPNTASGSPFSVMIRVTDSNSNAVNSSVLSFKVMADPTAGVTPSGPLTYDKGQSALTLKATVTYSGPNTVLVTWYSSTTSSCSSGSTNTGTVGTAFTPSTSTPGTMYYCAVVSDSGVPGYSNASNAVEVIVSPALVVPTPSVNHDPADVGQSVTFIAGPSGGSGTYVTYVWTGLPTGCTPSNNKTITCQPSTTSGSPFSVKVNVTDSNGYALTSSALSFTVDPALVVGIVTVNLNPIDVGQTINFTSTPASGGSGTYVYSWSGLPTGTGCTSANTLTIKCTPSTSAGSPFSIVIAVTDSNNHTVTSSGLSFAVSADPTVGVAPSGPLSYDLGQTAATLKATVTYSGPNTATVTWYNSTTVTCNAGSTPTGKTGSSYTPPTATAGTTYYCAVVTDSAVAGYTNVTNPVEIIVDPALVVLTPTVSQNPVDAGQAITFTASPTGGSGTYTNYVWIGLPTGCTTQNALKITCTPSTATGSPFSVTTNVTDSNGFSHTSPVLSFTVDPALVVGTVSVNLNPIDLGQTVIFTSTPATGGFGGYTYSWSGLPTGCTSVNNITLTCKPGTISGSPFNILVKVGDSNNNVVSSSALSFTANADPTVGVNPSGTLTYDVGQTAATLAATVVYSGANTATIQWFNSTNSNCNVGSTNTGKSGNSFTPSTYSKGTIYYCAVVSDSGVVGYSSPSTPVEVTVNVDPTISSFSVSPNSTKVGTSVTFNVSASGGTGLYSYKYTGLPGGCASSNKASLVCTPTVTGTFTIHAFVNDSANYSRSAFTALAVSPAVTLASVAVTPDKATVAPNGKQTFSVTITCSGGTCPSGAVYSWSMSPILGSFNSTTTPSVVFTAGSKTGTETLFVNVTLNGKTVQSAPIVVSISQSSRPTTFFSGTTLWIIIIVIVAVAAIVAALYMLRRKQGREPSPNVVESSSPTASSTIPASPSDSSTTGIPTSPTSSEMATTGVISAPAEENPPTPTSTKYCPKCGVPHGESAKFCKGCGSQFQPLPSSVPVATPTSPIPATVPAPSDGSVIAATPSSAPSPQPSSEKFCPKCGIQNRGGAVFCKGCGNRFTQTPSSESAQALVSPASLEDSSPGIPPAAETSAETSAASVPSSQPKPRKKKGRKNGAP